MISGNSDIFCGYLLTCSNRFFAAQIMYKVVITLDKVAILLLYYRVFYVHRSFRIAAHCVNAFIISSGLAFILATIFQCTPVSGVWDKGYEKAVCVNSKDFWISYATLNIATDLVLLGMPLHRLTRLKMSPLDKLGLALVFCTGLVFTATTIARTTTLAASANDKDPTWGPLPATYWSVIEANVGIVAACLPTLRRPFTFVFGRCFPRHDFKRTSYYSGRGSRGQGPSPAIDVKDHHPQRTLDDESDIGNNAP